MIVEKDPVGKETVDLGCRYQDDTKNGSQAYVARKTDGKENVVVTRLAV